MRNLAKICAVVVICLGATSHASNRHQPRISPFRPFAVISVPQTPMYLGMVSGSRTTQLKGEMTAHVVANRPFQVIATFKGLTPGSDKRVISPKHMKVVINGEEVPTGTGKVKIASGGPTPRGGIDVPIVLEVTSKGLASYPAGRYGADLVVAVKTVP